MTKTSRSSDEVKKCSFCGKNIYETPGVWVDWPAAEKHFCNKTCELLFGEKTGKTCFDVIAKGMAKKVEADLKKQKHEKIEKMALKFFQECIVEMECDSCSIPHALKASWHYAEKFLEFAKQKQEEANDE